ncbi:TonB-dependent receptor [Spongiibacter sp. KMU-166]|uniref:TonB-dependent receptor n=1 Tax=Spongiibacter thalassae TaxID=2721624 RepID=A0ABX1GCJ5_9GAMM|nr:TonB-dependent receptor [Spongiibacter thalassae]NKI16328.1 TonB-dependent receptor [Spongiibacter thalassae]
MNNNECGLEEAPHRCSVITPVLLGIVLSTPLWWQSALAQDGASTRKPRSSIIEEVIVSATKRDADLRDIPLSIDAFTGESLRDIGAADIESIARFSPGVSVSPGLDPEAAQIIIRGVSTDTFFTFFTRTFGMFYEDISMVNPSILGPQPNIDPYDMKTVEILKGPQGTLFGGSALSGAIRYVPNKPDFEEAYGQLAASVGQHARSENLSHRYDAMANVPVGDELALRVVASKSARPGYIEDLRSGEDDINSAQSQQVRALLTWRLTDDFALNYNGIRRETHQDDGAFANTIGEPTHSERYYADVIDSRTDIHIVSAEWAFETFDLVAIVSNMTKDYPQRLDYSQFIGTSQTNTGTYGDTFIESEQPSAELRIVSGEPTDSDWWVLRDWTYVAGVFYVYSDQFLALNIGTDESGDTLRLQGDVDAEEYAGFFDVTRSLGERWEVGLGARYFRQSTEADIETTLLQVSGLPGVGALGEAITPVVGEMGATVGGSLGRDVGRIAETVFNPKLTVKWAYSDGLSIFASAVKGFRYAGANQNPTRDPDVPLFFKSDNIWNYELGMRTEWFEGAIQFDVTAFHLKWTDMQVQQREYTGAFAYTTNVGGAESTGVEFGLNTLLPGGFAVKLNGSYVDAHTTTFFDDFQGPAEAGTELPGSPPLSGSLLVAWLGNLGSAEIVSTVTYTYQESNYNNLAQTYEHPPMELLGASVNFRFPEMWGEPSINLVGNNLTNEFEPGVVFDTPNTGGILTIYNPPRSVTLGIEFNLR